MYINITGDITIREGEAFLLPARVAHSPQRFKDTIGLVIERQRNSNEFDCLRWYTSLNDESSKILFERWFHCYDLGQLNSLIEEFVTSREFILGKPGPGSFLRKAVFEEASNVIIHPPISLVEEAKRISTTTTTTTTTSSSSSPQKKTLTTGPVYRCLFHDLKFTSSVTLYGPGKHSIEYLCKSGCDLFLLQLVRSFFLSFFSLFAFWK